MLYCIIMRSSYQGALFKFMKLDPKEPIADSFAIVKALGLAKDQFIKIPTGFETTAWLLPTNKVLYIPT